MSGHLRVGIVGLGFFGARHARIYSEHPSAEVVALCDLDETLVSRMASEFGATGFTDIDEMLSLDGLDAISICLPDRLHESVAIAAAQAGKAILLEKPLAHSADVSERIVSAVERAGSRLMVGHVLRFDPRYVRVFEASAPEILGEVIHLRAERTGIRATAERLGSASSILFYTGVHDVDALQWVARSRISRVYAQQRAILGNGNEDSLFATLNFENGAIGQLSYSWAWPNGLTNGYRAALEIVGTRSAAFLDCADQGFYSVSEDTITGGDTHLWPEINGRIVGDLADEIGHFITATLSGENYWQHYSEAMDAIPVLDALALSAASGKVVDVLRYRV